MDPILEISDLSKSFKGFDAVKNLSFSISKGEVYGFLGQNGAGKSTTMRMILGLIYPDTGRIFINGILFSNSRRHLLRNIGAIIERPDMYGYLSGYENLKIFATLSDPSIKAARLQEVLEIVGLTSRAKDKVKAYSQGMKQRLGIAIAMVHQPDLLILDEPTNGLDPQGIAEMRSLILSLSRDHGKTIVISSHLLHEVEQVASSILIIHKGRKISDGPVSRLLNPNETLIEFSVGAAQDLAGQLLGTPWAHYLQPAQPGMLVFKMNPSHIPALNKWLVEKDVAVCGINTKHSFESYFLSITDDTAAQN